MKVLIFTIGSHGDVHPFVGLGIELRRRGHDVVLITNAHFEILARSAGLDFAEMGTDQQFRKMMDDPDLWHPWRGFDAVFLRGVIPTLEQAYRVIERLNDPGKTLMVASSLGLAARIAQERLGIPTATIHIQPAVLRTIYDVPKLPGLPIARWMPYWLRRWVWDGGDKYVIDPKIAPAINEFRGSLGLAPVRGIINQWWNSPQRIIGFWPEWYGPTQPDWPKQLRVVGFPLYDETGITPLSDELDTWLSAGDAPIAFTPGSAMAQGRNFFDQSVLACQRIGRRGLLLTRHADQIPADLPSSVRHVDYAPFGALLPRCAALVHHGGIGTTAQALKAGVPQVIMPMAHDQFDNAHRVCRLGVGASIKRTHYRAPKVAATLSDLLGSPTLPQACRTVAARFAGSTALQQAADCVEQLASAQVPDNHPVRTH